MKLSYSIFAAVILTASPAFALEGDGTAEAMQHSQQCGLPMGEGTVTGLDVKASKATIDHAPITALGWDAMVMDFQAAKGVDLSAFAAGDRVHFLLAEDAKSKSYRIEAICALDASPGLHDACMGQMHETAMSVAEASGKPCAMEGMDHSNMKGMDHSKMEGMDHGAMEGMDHSQMPGMKTGAAPEAPAATKPAVDHSQH